MKKYISVILISCFLLQLIGCYSMREVTQQEFIEQLENNKIRITTNRYEYTFEAEDYSLLNDSIAGRGVRELKENNLYVDNSEVFSGKISLNDVQKFEITKINIVRIVFAIGVPMTLLYIFLKGLSEFDMM